MGISMVDLLYLSHTAIPAHLNELEGLGLLEEHEKVLVVLDGVLLDSNGRRVGGPTLHDYCLLTNRRVLLWARDYGRHLCYAFPLHELCIVEGTGLDPMHAHLHIAFAAPDEEEEQHFALILLPLVDLAAAVSLLRLAAQTAMDLAAQGAEAQEIGDEVSAALGIQIFGTPDGQRPSGRVFRSAESEGRPDGAGMPGFSYDQRNLPSEIYSAGRLGRAAWDTFRRTLREAELPLNLNNDLRELLNGGDLRDLADTLRAMNELLSTLSGDPNAREMAMAFLNRRAAAGGSPASTGESRERRQPPPSRYPPPGMPGAQDMREQQGATEEESYHEIPLRQRGERRKPTKGEISAKIPTRRAVEPKRPAEAEPATATTTAIPLRRRNEAKPTLSEQQPATPDRVDRGDIPLRRKNGTQPMSNEKPSSRES